MKSSRKYNRKSWHVPVKLVYTDGDLTRRAPNKTKVSIGPLHTTPYLSSLSYQRRADNRKDNCTDMSLQCCGKVMVNFHCTYDCLWNTHQYLQAPIIRKTNAPGYFRNTYSLHQIRIEASYSSIYTSRDHDANLSLCRVWSSFCMQC